MLKPLCVCGRAYDAHDDNLQIPGTCDGYEEMRNLRVYLFTGTTEEEWQEIAKFLDSHPGISGYDVK